MSDARLRELERRAAETGLASDQAALLRERVRVGRLPLARLELAAWCDHAAARLALGDAAPLAPPDLLAWARGLDRWGDAVRVRAAIAAARQALGVEPGEGCAAAIDAAEAWCDRPSHEAGARALAAARAVAPTSDRLKLELAGLGEPTRANARWYATWLAFNAARAAAYTAATAAWAAGLAPPPEITLEADFENAIRRAAALAGFEETGRPPGDVDAVRRAIQRALCAHALG